MSQQSQRADNRTCFLDIPDYWVSLFAGRSRVRIPVGAKIILFFKTPLGLCGPSNSPFNGYRYSFWSKATAAWSSIW